MGLLVGAWEFLRGLGAMLPVLVVIAAESLKECCIPRSEVEVMGVLVGA